MLSSLKNYDFDFCEVDSEGYLTIKDERKNIVESYYFGYKYVKVVNLFFDTQDIKQESCNFGVITPNALHIDIIDKKNPKLRKFKKIADGRIFCHERMKETNVFFGEEEVYHVFRRADRSHHVILHPLPKGFGGERMIKTIHFETHILVHYQDGTVIAIGVGDPDSASRNRIGIENISNIYRNGIEPGYVTLSHVKNIQMVTEKSIIVEYIDGKTFVYGEDGCLSIYMGKADTTKPCHTVANVARNIIETEEDNPKANPLVQFVDELGNKIDSTCGKTRFKIVKDNTKQRICGPYGFMIEQCGSEIKVVDYDESFRVKDGICYLKDSRLVFIEPRWDHFHIVFHDFLIKKIINKWIFPCPQEEYQLNYLDATDTVVRVLDCRVASARTNSVQGFINNVQDPDNVTDGYIHSVLKNEGSYTFDLVKDQSEKSNRICPNTQYPYTFVLKVHSKE